MITRPVSDYKFTSIYNDSSFISLALKIIANTFCKILNYYYHLVLLLNTFIHFVSSGASIIYRHMLKVEYTVNSFRNNKSIYLRSGKL